MALLRALPTLFFCASLPACAPPPTMPSGSPDGGGGPSWPEHEHPTAELEPFEPDLRAELADPYAAEPTWLEGGAIRRWDGVAIEEVAPAPGVALAGTLRVVADDDVWLLAGGDLRHWDGAEWSAPPLEGAVVHVLPVANVWVEAIAADTPGEAWALVDVWGQGDARHLRLQLCRLERGEWTCEPIGITEGTTTPTGRMLVLAAGRLWMVANDGSLHRRGDLGGFSLALGGVVEQILARDDGSVAILRRPIGGSWNVVEIVSADGTTVTPLGVHYDLVADRGDGSIYALHVDTRGDGSCAGSVSGYCVEGVADTRVRVYRVDGEEHPIAYGGTTGDGLPVVPIVLPDGRLVVSLATGSFVTPADPADP